MKDNLPDCVGDNDLNAPWNEKGHHEACPQHEDAQPKCAECGLPELPHKIIPISKLPHDFIEDEDPDCECADIATNEQADKADAAEMRAEIRADQERDDR